jgi:hypothetical protein
MKDFMKKLAANPAVQKAAVGLIIAVMTFLATYFGSSRPVQVVEVEKKTPLVWPTDEPRTVGAQGWIEDKDSVAQVVAGLAVKSFAGTEAGGVDEATLPDHIYSWQYWEKVTGAPIPNKDQGGVGDCTGFGNATAIETTMVMSIAHGKREGFKPICEEALYAGARIQIGRGQIRGDGAVGAWVAKYVNQWGITPREQIGTVDLTHYSEARARDWGRTGAPGAVLTAAKDHPVRDITQVLNWVECKKALASGYGVSLCSNQGFSMNRNANGVCQPKGQWAHCMAIIGYHTEAGKEYGFIMNSWGPKAFTGPTGWGNAPTGGFWAEASVIDRMLRQNDSWTFSDVRGFPAKKITDWPVRVTPKKQPAVGPLVAVAL